MMTALTKARHNDDRTMMTALTKARDNDDRTDHSTVQ